MDDPTKLSWIEFAMNICTLLVAIGVAGEFVGNWMAGPVRKRLDNVKDAEIAGLNKQAGDAFERAANAEKDAADANRIAEQERLARAQLEARIAPRNLSKEQQGRISSELSKLSGQYVTVAFINDSFEAAAFASQIRDALSEAKWHITQFSPTTPGGNGLPIVKGVAIMTEPPEGSKVAAAAVLSAITKEGVSAFIIPLRTTPAEEAPFLNDPNDPMNNRVLVVVGSHP